MTALLFPIVDEAPSIDDLRAAGKLVVDEPTRKVGLYANHDRQVVFMFWQAGVRVDVPLEQHESSALRRALIREIEVAAKAWDRCEAHGVALNAVARARSAE